MAGGRFFIAPPCILIMIQNTCVLATRPVCSMDSNDVLYTEEYVSPDTKLADCMYQCEKTSRSNHSASKELKLLFKVLFLYILHLHA